MIRYQNQTMLQYLCVNICVFPIYLLICECPTTAIYVGHPHVDGSSNMYQGLFADPFYNFFLSIFFNPSVRMAFAFDWHVVILNFRKSHSRTKTQTHQKETTIKFHSMSSLTITHTLQ